MENLKALVYKGDLTPYQRALAKREFEGIVERLEIYEKAVKNNAVLPLVSNQRELLLAFVDFFQEEIGVFEKTKHAESMVDAFLSQQ